MSGKSWPPPTGNHWISLSPAAATRMLRHIRCAAIIGSEPGDLRSCETQRDTLPSRANTKSPTSRAACQSLPCGAGAFECGAAAAVVAAPPPPLAERLGAGSRGRDTRSRCCATDLGPPRGANHGLNEAKCPPHPPQCWSNQRVVGLGRARRRRQLRGI